MVSRPGLMDRRLLRRVAIPAWCFVELRPPRFVCLYRAVLNGDRLVYSPLALSNRSKSRIETD